MRVIFKTADGLRCETDNVNIKADTVVFYRPLYLQALFTESALPDKMDRRKYVFRGYSGDAMVFQEDVE